MTGWSGLLAVALLVVCGAVAGAQGSANPGTGMLPLEGGWVFHAGDDSGWAESRLDEAGWRAIQPDVPWGDQGFRGYTGYGWYRRHVMVRGPGPALAVLLPSVDDNYEVFWNGRSVGVYGGFPPRARLWNVGHAATYLLPGTEGGTADGVLAIRVWKMQLSTLDSFSVGGLTATPVLGDAAVLGLVAQGMKGEHDHTFWTRSVLSGVVLLAGLISLLVYLRGGRQPIYLALALYLIADAAAAIENIALWYRTTLFEEQLANGARGLICTVALWWVLLYLFGMSGERRWRRLTAALGLLYLMAEIADCTALYLWQYTSPVLRWADGLSTLVYAVLPVYLFALLWAGLRRHQRVALWPLAVSLSAYQLYQIVIDVTSQGARYTGIHFSQLIDGWTVSVVGYPVGMRTMLDALFLAALLVTMARWQAAERRRQEGLALEIRSAQEIQRVLVPERLPELPGFRIEALYRPAEEVGGDFFQTMPTADGGVLVVIGDVSGKGLKAAMTVSLVVGAIRTLAEVSDSPAAMLEGLNRRLVGRTASGFATCLALRVDAAGRATVANAGHLPPFVDGHEVELEGSVPLGLADGMVYEESALPMKAGDSVVLYTDGLLEARSRAGELYGFARVAALLGRRPTLAEVMAEAQGFGQEDDITLLLLARQVG